MAAGCGRARTRNVIATEVGRLMTVEVEQPAPDFRLKGPSGQPVTLSEYRGKKNVLLVFFPMAFSPTCSVQLPSIQKDSGRLDALDVIVLGISVDNHYANERFAAMMRLDFPLLSDTDRSTCRAYGVWVPERGYGARALFLVDKRGIVIFKDVSTAPAEDPQMPSHERAIDVLRRGR
jgi:peroxiredoxin